VDWRFLPDSRNLKVVDVAQFERIRVVADYERTGSGTGMNVRLTITEGNEPESFALAAKGTNASASRAAGTRVAPLAGDLSEN
jgi:hypothetical protein